MGNLYLTVGPPASGKSTWAVHFMQNQMANGRNAMRIERDMIRAEISEREGVVPHGKGWKKKFEDEISDKLKRTVVENLKEGDIDVIVSDTNLSDRALDSFRQIANNLGVEIKYVLFRTERDDLFRFNQDRENWREVPHYVINDMYTRMVESWPRKYASIESGGNAGMDAYGPNVFEGITVTGDLRVDKVISPDEDNEVERDIVDTVVVDIDGTLACRQGRSPYDESRVYDDILYEDIAQLVDLFYSKGYNVVLMSGRHNSCREDTLRWLHYYHIRYHSLYMRPADDNIKDSVIKTEMFWQMYTEEAVHGERLLNVQYVLDDRDQTVAQWRRMGLRCLQVREGNF